MKRRAADVVVVGAGVIGSSIARDLARRGASVMVLDRDAPGRQASWAAAGMLSPLGEALDSGPFLELCDQSLTRFAAFARDLEAESGIDVEYRTSGRLHVSLGDADDDLDAIAAQPAAARFGVSRLDADEARRLEPNLPDRVTGALLIERDHHVNNRLLTQAVIAAATHAGAAFHKSRAVASLILNGNTAAGVRLESGEEVSAKHIVLAAGAWSGQLEGLPRHLPVHPVRGQMFAVDGRGPHTPQPLIEHVIYSRGCYIVPRDDGRLLAGATVEDVGFRQGPTARGIGGLMAAAADVLPIMHDLPLVETWSGFRPATPDQLPIIGNDPAMSGLTYATGHFRNGILLAPITAECIAAIVGAAAAPLNIQPFDVSRFDAARV